MMDLHIGDFIIRQHWCFNNKITYREGPYIVEITFKKSQLGKYGAPLYRECKIKGRCIRCHSIIDIYDDDYKKIDKDVGRFIKCLLEQ